MSTSRKFFKETYNRLFTGETPFYFRIWRMIGTVLVVLYAISEILNLFVSSFGDLLSESAIGNINKIIGLVGMLIVFFSQMVKSQIFSDKMPLSKPTDPDE